VSLFKKGCSEDGEYGCSCLGFMYEKGIGVPVDRRRAVDLYRQGAHATKDEWFSRQLTRMGQSL
jgi:TPR repeat protein